MEKHIEKEYKILLSKDDFNKLKSLYPNINFVRQTNYYYDNLNKSLRNNHMAMRIREKEDKFLFTLKVHGSLGLEEYEIYVDHNGSDIFDTEEIKNTLALFNIEGPFINFATLQTDRAMYITEDYELCFDINEYNHIIDYEVEYEYVREHDGLSNFQNILDNINIKYEKNSEAKIKRALKSI